ncbi:MAG: acyl-CoA dehydrogenase family protein [Candidatus Rokubacteria bacterium]|nr:acyl-CoA dehydrogenase family protein [Candidatus Rokubacteria bacterium]
MDFRLSKAELEFRDRLRQWLAENAPGDWAKVRRRFASAEGRVAFLRDWQRKLHAAGYVGLAWPQAYGGGGATLTEQAIFYEEMARARAPELPNVIGLDMAGPALIAHGTEAQKRTHLARILSAEHVFCQGFSEPNAGSDLAALQTRAVRDGHGDWVVTGQKVWTSFAHFADWCILLARTDPDAPKHKGLTFFLVDMRSPGVSVRPLRQASGDAEFNELFLDAVRVDADQVVGRPNGGWEVAVTTLMFERGPRTISRQLLLRQGLDAAIDLARALDRDGRRAADDPVVRQRLAQFVIDAEALRLSTLRALTRQLRGATPGPEGSAAKLFWSETWQRLLELTLELLGPYAMLSEGSDRAIEDGYWQYRFLRSRGDTIAAGTSEINRNILAERVLGLPKD